MQKKKVNFSILKFTGLFLLNLIMCIYENDTGIIPLLITVFGKKKKTP